MNIVLQKGVATDLYAATGFGVGTQIRVQNQSEQLVTLADSSAGLARNATGNCTTLQEYKTAVNKTGATGAWAIAETGAALINVVEV